MLREHQSQDLRSYSRTRQISDTQFTGMDENLFGTQFGAFGRIPVGDGGLDAKKRHPPIVGGRHPPGSKTLLCTCPYNARGMLLVCARVLLGGFAKASETRIYANLNDRLGYHSFNRFHAKKSPVQKHGAVTNSRMVGWLIKI